MKQLGSVTAAQELQVVEHRLSAIRAFACNRVCCVRRGHKMQQHTTHKQLPGYDPGFSWTVLAGVGMQASKKQMRTHPPTMCPDALP